MANNFEHGKQFEAFAKEAIKEWAGNKPMPPTAIWDLPAQYNIWNIPTSVKSFGGSTIALSDTVRFFSHKEPYRLIAAPFRQIGSYKQVSVIYEFAVYPKVMQTKVFQQLKLEHVQGLSDLIKQNAYLPKDQLDPIVYAERDRLAQHYQSLIHLDPKIDHGKQRRLQCSVKLAALLDNIPYQIYHHSFYDSVLPWRISSVTRNL